MRLFCVKGGVDMDLAAVASRIRQAIEREPHSATGYQDLLSVYRELIKTEQETAVEGLKWLSERLEGEILEVVREDVDTARKMATVHRGALLEAAPYDFECYLLYVELAREPQAKFYPPRRKVLKQVVDELQQLADDKLDLLCISLPPGSGKTTLAIFYLTWLAGRIPDQPMLTGSHSNTVTGGSVWLWTAPPDCGGSKAKTVHKGDALLAPALGDYKPVTAGGELYWINGKYIKEG